jgi:class 3 adenylate cyclase/TolB-like protein
MTEAPASEPTARHLPRVRKAVLVADVVDSTQLTHRHGLDYIDRWRRFLDEVRATALPQRGGRFVKSTGDGLMAVFDHAASAAAAALELQQRMLPYNRDREPDAHIMLRAGVHAGEVYESELDVWGDPVNLAHRITGLAAPGEVVVTPEVRDHLVPGVDADAEDLGERFAKHVDGPIRLYRLGGAALPRPLGVRQALELKPGIAVIPFECTLGQDPGDLFGEALADEVIAQLARSAELHVISGLSTRGLKGRRLGLQESAAHLGAAYVLSGRYRMQGDRARLQIELADVRSERVVWADTIDTTVREALDLDAALPGTVALQVARNVLERELERVRTHPLPALESYALLFGAVSLMHRLSLRDFERARALLDELAERHGRSPVAHAWMAKWHVLRAAQGWVADSNQEFLLAQDRVQRALDADSRHALALAIGGLVQVYLRHDLPAAGRLYDDAMEAGPNEPLAWLFSATWHAYHGRGETAAERAERALRLSPLDPMRYFFDSLAATALLSDGHWVQSEQLSRRSIRANRMHSSSWRTLIMALRMQGKEAEAREAAAGLLAVEPAFRIGPWSERFPGRGGPLAAPLAQALREAGLPE